MNVQLEVLKRNIDSMLLQDHHDGLNDQDRHLLNLMIKELHQHEHERKSGQP